MKWRKKVSIGLAGVCLSFGLMGCTFEGETYSPEQVIENALDDSKGTTPYYGEVKMKIFENDEVIEEVQMKEWLSKDGKKRIESQSVDSKDQTIVTMNLQQMMMYMPHEKRAFTSDEPGLIDVQKTPYEQATAMLKLIGDSHELAVKEGGKIAGRETYQLTATAKDSQSILGEQQIWLDKKTWIALKSVSTSGNTTIVSEYTKIDFDRQMKDDLFQLSLPEDVKVESLDDLNETVSITTAEIPEKLGKPALLVPENEEMRIASIELNDLKGELDRTEITVHYEQNGAPAFMLSMFQAPASSVVEEEKLPKEEIITIRSQEGTKTADGQFRSLMWDESGIRYVVVLMDPQLTFEEMEQMIEAMTLVK